MLFMFIDLNNFIVYQILINKIRLSKCEPTNVVVHSTNACLSLLNVKIW